MKQQVGLFFCIDGMFLFHGCDLEYAEDYGEFKVYDKSHFEIWDEFYYKVYKVDFDYYPRGRVVYKSDTGTFLIYKDNCISDDDIQRLLADFEGYNYQILEDEHYRCHICNDGYVNVCDLPKGLFEEKEYEYLSIK